MNISRRHFLGALGTTALGASLANIPLQAADDEVVRSAVDHELPSFDQEVTDFMRTRGVPGGALAVVKDGRLVYARGYGWADRERKEPATPHSLFRIASISKPLTAVGVLLLVEQHRLSLDDLAFDFVKVPPHLPPGAELDMRWEKITIRQLLQHTGGWDRNKEFDPMFRARQIAEELKVPSPAGPEAVIRYMRGRRLDFDPGQEYAYSNFGYCLLGRIIEAVTGSDYERFMKQKVFAPIGIRRARIGASLRSGRVAGEVVYYEKTEELAPSVFGDDEVPWPYGGFHLEAMDAHGGWIMSAVDLARFTAAVDDPEKSPLLKPASFQAMYAPPAAPVSRTAEGKLQDSYYACGWLVRPVGSAGKANYWHNGSLAGTNTWLVRRHDGLSWAILFNLRSEDKALPDGAIDGALHRAANAVKAWPEGVPMAQVTDN